MGIGKFAFMTFWYSLGFRQFNVGVCKDRFSFMEVVCE